MIHYTTRGWLSGNKMAALQLEDKSIWDDADVSSGVVLRGTVMYKPIKIETCALFPYLGDDWRRSAPNEHRRDHQSHKTAGEWYKGELLASSWTCWRCLVGKRVRSGLGRGTSLIVVYMYGRQSLLRATITCMSRVEVFATGIKIESSHQSPFWGPIKGWRWPLSCWNHLSP